MKKFLSVSLVFILIFTMFASTALANGSDVQLHNEELHEFIEGQLIVSIEPKHDRKSKPSIQNRGSLKSEEAKLKKKGFKLKEALHNEEDVVCTLIFSNSFNAEVIDHMGLVYLIEYDVNDFKSEKHAKREIEKEIKKLGYNVRYVSNNYIIEGVTSEAVAQSTTSTSMHRNQRWHYEMINAPQAWSITEGSRDVKIAVLDTGIDHNHPNLRNFVDTRLSRSFVDNNPLDVNGHGTHVAGTIASYGSVSGVMRNATLVNVKVLGDSGGGSLFAIQQGILYASEIGSDVINMSLGGGGYHRGMDEAAQTAVARGSIVIAASGNDSRSSISYPAAYNSVIAVGSVTSNRTRSSFSNYGNGLEIMAPGSSIYSTYPNGTFRTLNGTSMAAPHVAGVAGLMRSANPNLTVAEARQILRETAQPAGNFFEYGYGIVDAYAAVQRAAGATNSTNTAVTTSKTAYEKGEAINVTTTVTDQNGQPLAGAAVQFSLQGPNGIALSTTRTTNTSGQATWSLSTSEQTPLGLYTIGVETNLSGYVPSSATTTFEMVERNVTQTTVTTNKTEYERGENINVSASVTDQNGQALAGATVNFTLTRPNGTTVTGSAISNTSGQATWTLSSSEQTALGTFTVRAETSLSGYVPSAATTTFEMVERNVTQTTVTTNKTEYERGENINVSASVTDQNGQALAGATVNFTLTRPNGTTVTGSAISNTSGQATWTLSSSEQTALGTFTVTAQTTLSGYETSTASTTFEMIQVNLTETSVTTNKLNYRRGESVTFTATVTNNRGQLLQNATVQFVVTRPNGTQVTNAVTTNASGIATWTIGTSSNTPTGTYRIDANTSFTGYVSSSASNQFTVSR